MGRAGAAATRETCRAVVAVTRLELRVAQRAANRIHTTARDAPARLRAAQTAWGATMLKILGREVYEWLDAQRPDEVDIERTTVFEVIRRRVRIYRGGHLAATRRLDRAAPAIASVIFHPLTLTIVVAAVVYALSFVASTGHTLRELRDVSRGLFP